MDSEKFDIKSIHTQFWEIWNNILGPSFQGVCWWIRPTMHFTEDNDIYVAVLQCQWEHYTMYVLSIGRKFSCWCHIMAKEHIKQ